MDLKQVFKIVFSHQNSIFKEYIYIRYLGKDNPRCFDQGYQFAQRYRKETFQPTFSNIKTPNAHQSTLESTMFYLCSHFILIYDELTLHSLLTRELIFCMCKCAFLTDLYFLWQYTRYTFWHVTLTLYIVSNISPHMSHLMKNLHKRVAHAV